MAREWEDDNADERVDWHRMTTAEGRRLDWQLVGTPSAGGRRLLIVELNAEAEARVIDAIGVLVGRSVARDELLKPRAILREDRRVGGHPS